MKSIQNPLGEYMVQNTYVGDRVSEQLDARGKLWKFGWDSVEQLATLTDPRNHEWKNQYDGNVLRQIIDPLGRTTHLFWDGDLNLVMVRDAAGRAHRASYDAQGNLLERF